MKTPYAILISLALIAAAIVFSVLYLNNGFPAWM